MTTYHPLRKPNVKCDGDHAQRYHDLGYEHAQKVWAFVNEENTKAHLRLLGEGKAPITDQNKFVRFMAQRDLGRGGDEAVIKLLIAHALAGTDPSADYEKTILVRQDYNRGRRASAAQPVATTEVKPVATKPKQAAKKPKALKLTSTTGNVADLGKLTDEQYESIRSHLDRITDKTGVRFTAMLPNWKRVSL